MKTENRETFERRLKKNMSKEEIRKVMFIYDLVKSAHRTQFRDDKQTRYFEHPRQGCLVLMDELHCYNPKLITAFLLHDVGEDTALLGSISKGYEDWKNEAKFRLNILYPGISSVVIALTKPTGDNEQFATKEDAYRHYLKGLQKDEEVILCKMVDKLINSRDSLNSTNKTKTKSQIKELEIDYFPIFSRFAETSLKYKAEFAYLWDALQQIIESLKRKFKENQTIYEVKWEWANYSPDSFEAPFSTMTVQYSSAEKLAEDLISFKPGPNTKYSKVEGILVSLEEYESFQDGKRVVKTFN